MGNFLNLPKCFSMCTQNGEDTNVVQFFYFIVKLNIRKIKCSALFGHTMNPSELTGAEFSNQC